MSAPAGARRPAVFIDRDGCLVVERDYLVSPDELELVPRAGEALAALNAAGVPAVLVTNQSAVARGLLTEAGLEQIHARLEQMLAEAGAQLDLVLACPHHPTEGAAPYRRECECRKPGAGMLFAAAERLGLDLAASWMVGDSARDLEAGRRAGARPILVATGKGLATQELLLAQGVTDHLFVPSLAEAIEFVLAERWGVSG